MKGEWFLVPGLDGSGQKTDRGETLVGTTYERRAVSIETFETADGR